MRKYTINYLPDLVNAHFTNDNNSFESALVSIIRVLNKEGEKKISGELSTLLSKHRSGLFHTNYTRNTTKERSSSQNKFLISINTEKTIENLVLNTVTKKKIEDVILSYKNSEKLKEIGLTSIQKILLSGLPGTGKSTLGLVIANELDMDVFIVKTPYLFSSYLGDSGKAIMELFNTIKEMKAVIIFDEFDSIGVGRGNTNEVGEMRRVVNTVLTNLDQWSSESLLIATTNDLKSIDSALWRRFDQRIQIDLPDEVSRLQLWDEYTQNMLKREELKFLAKMTSDYSPAEIENIAHQALRMKIIKNEDVFLNIIKNTHNFGDDKTIKKELTLYLKSNHPKLTLREIGEIVGLSKSTVQRYLTKGGL